MNSASSGESRTSKPELPGDWDRLELAVRRLLDEYAGSRRRLRAAQERIRELEVALRELGAGTLDPTLLSARIEDLEAENRSLRDRLIRAHDGVRRILARIRFLEEGR